MFVNKGTFGKKFYVWSGLDKTGTNLIKLMKYKIGIWCSLFVKWQSCFPVGLFLIIRDSERIFFKSLSRKENFISCQNKSLCYMLSLSGLWLLK